ncbi:MAG: DUF4870 domain-containing protein [Candidatus Sulfotelmatobacter sp.]
MAFCNMCGTQIPDGATTCAACAGRIPAASTATPAATQGMTDNVAGMLAYITIIPAIIFLVVEPYNRNRFIRFHSFQCLFFAAALLILHFGLGILAIIPGIALLTFPLHMVINLGAFILWIILLIKANQGQMYKLPIIGNLAEQQANVR